VLTPALRSLTSNIIDVNEARIILDFVEQLKRTNCTAEEALFKLPSPKFNFENLLVITRGFQSGAGLVAWLLAKALGEMECEMEKQQRIKDARNSALEGENRGLMAGIVDNLGMFGAQEAETQNLKRRIMEKDG
jgi:hypothetical protein